MWALLTVSTVGSNVVQPASLTGKFIGGACPIVGVVLLTLPVPIIVNSFADQYRNRICRTEIREKKERKLQERRLSCSSMNSMNSNYIASMIIPDDKNNRVK